MFIVKCILTEAFSPVNNFLMFIIKFYMFYNEFYTFYNKTQTNCNPWHPIPSPTKKAAALRPYGRKGSSLFVLHQITAYTAIIRWLHT
jgi:hypothetical protein